ncbi:MAG TPA: hypothetical protein VMS98_06635 [Thermoanaerobaculia bacterium]|nr:hypothetical protein [Thermoanaerobaculia bacterium]
MSAAPLLVVRTFVDFATVAFVITTLGTLRRVPTVRFAAWTSSES